MAVRPATYARDPQRREAGTAPRLNKEPWPHMETGRRLRRMLDSDGGKERSSKTLRRLSGK